MAHIRRHPKSPDRWQVRYRDPSGRERSRNFARHSDAERFLHTVEVDKLRGTYTDPRLARTTFGEWTARWWGTTAHLKPYTRAGYESLLRTHVLTHFGAAPLGQIQPVGIREWLSDLHRAGLSVSRIRSAYFLMGQILRSAVESGYLARTPCVGVDLPREQRREARFLSAGEVDRLAEATREPYGTLIYTLAYGGLRWGEATALRRSRCDLLRSRLEVVESLAEVSGHLHFGATKTYQRRTVTLPGFLRDRLAEHLARSTNVEPEAVVFTAQRGGPLRHGNFSRRVWRPAVEAAGLPDGLTIHELRHTCAALLIAQGAHPKAVQAHLGHSSIQVTMDRYGHLFPSEAEELAERMDSAFREAHTDTRRTPDPARVIEVPTR